MINQITFESKVAMNRAMCAIFGGHSRRMVTESEENTQTPQTGAEQNGTEQNAGAQDANQTGAEQTAQGTQTTNESKGKMTIKQKLAQGRDNPIRRKFRLRNSKKVDECGQVSECGNQVAEGCGGKKIVKEGILGGIAGGVLGSAAGIPGAVAGAYLGHKVQDAGNKNEAVGADGDEDQEGVENAGGAEGGDNAELVDRASAVSERIASIKEKFQEELNADDGLKMGDNDDETEGGAEGTATED